MSHTEKIIEDIESGQSAAQALRAAAMTRAALMVRLRHDPALQARYDAAIGSRRKGGRISTSTSATAKYLRDLRQRQAQADMPKRSTMEILEPFLALRQSQKPGQRQSQNPTP